MLIVLFSVTHAGFKQFCFLIWQQMKLSILSLINVDQRENVKYFGKARFSLMSNIV